jgi:hypothetical protein
VRATWEPEAIFLMHPCRCLHYGARHGIPGLPR